MPTMEDVAKRADVSKSTVSLVLNRKSGVSPELTEIVLRAAEDLGYRHPKQISRRAAESRNIAVVHAQSTHQNHRHSSEPTDLYLNYINGIRTFVKTVNLNLTLIANYNEDDMGQLAFRLLHSDTQTFDGLIFIGSNARQNSQLIDQIIKENRPAVALSRTWPNLPISTVGPDYRQQVFMALAHLADLGHRQIAFVSSEDDRRFDWYQWRLDHYREYMQTLNGAVDEDLIATGADGAEASVSLLHRRPDVTAIFAINDGRAMEGLTGIQRLGLQVPHDIALIGQDNVVEFVYDEPMLTTVGFPHMDVGYLAAELLLKQMQSSVISHCNIWVECRLIERASCAPPGQR